MIVLRTKTYSWFNFGSKKTTKVEEEEPTIVDKLIQLIQKSNYRGYLCDQFDELCYEESEDVGELTDQEWKRLESLFINDFNKKIQTLFNQKHLGNTEDYDLQSARLERKGGVLSCVITFNDYDNDKDAFIWIPLNQERGETRATVKTFSKTENEKIKTGLGVAAAGGIGLAKMNKDEFTGRVKRYHATDKDVMNKIKEEGLKASKANDSSTYTKQLLRDIPEDKLNNKVYLGKDKIVSKSVGKGRELRGRGKQGILELIDYDDWKKMKKVENPELRGAKNAEELYRKMGNGGIFGRKWEHMDPIEKLAFKKGGYDILGEKGTEVIEGDIASKHIKGGKGYEKNSVKKIAKYAKKHPGRFAKGAAKVGAGVAVTGTGLAIAGKGLSDKKKNKTFSDKETDYQKDRRKKLATSITTAGALIGFNEGAFGDITTKYQKKASDRIRNAQLNDIKKRGQARILDAIVSPQVAPKDRGTYNKLIRDVENRLGHNECATSKFINKANRSVAKQTTKNIVKGTATGALLGGTVAAGVSLAQKKKHEKINRGRRNKTR